MYCNQASKVVFIGCYAIKSAVVNTRQLGLEWGAREGLGLSSIYREVENSNIMGANDTTVGFPVVLVD